MSVDVVIPEVGEAGMSVTFVAWLKEEGDVVKEGEPLFQLDTEKSLFEAEAFAGGRLVDVRVKPGDRVEPRQVIARLVSDREEPARPAETGPGSDATALEQSASRAISAVSRGSPTVQTPSRTRVSPRARRYAEQRGLDPATVTGTGPDGLVTEEDVERALMAARPQSDGPQPHARSEKVRRAVAERTSSAWRAIPHIALALDADVTDGLQSTKPLVLVCERLTRALGEHPECNLQWQGESLVRRDTVDLGILVDAPAGLLMTAVRSANALSRDQLATAIAEAAARARGGRLSPDDFGARSISVSNLGQFSVDGFVGVIAQPDVLLLTVGRVRTEARWRDGEWEPRQVLPLVISADHRALDGADVARLLTTLERHLSSRD